MIIAIDSTAVSVLSAYAEDHGFTHGSVRKKVLWRMSLNGRALGWSITGTTALPVGRSIVEAR